MVNKIPVSLTPEEEAALVAEAKAKGVSVHSLLRKAVLQVIAPCEVKPLHREVNGEELEKAFEEMADLIPENVPPIPDEALRRDRIYTREDEW